MRITLFHNPNAGYGDLKQDDVLSLLRRAGYEPRIVSSKGDEIDRALEDPGEIVVVAGGDGTVAKIAMKLAGRDTPIAILCLGTANNIARSLGVDGSVESQIGRWQNATPKHVDLGIAKGRFGEEQFIESFGVGLIAMTIRNIEPMHQKSQQKFDSRQEEFVHAYREMKKILDRTAARDYAIALDGVDHSGRYVLVEAMNMSHIGPNLPLAPSADVSDGMLDVVLLPESNRERFSEYLARRIEGAEQPSDLHVRRVRNATIDPRGSPLHIDDELHSESHEPLEPPGAVEVSAAAGQLTFLIP